MSNNIINKIQISGQSYDVKDSSAATVVELTQQEYDNLPSSAKTGNTLFVITDAQAGDLTNYYTKSETNTLLGGKADTATTYTKTEVDTALGDKQATLVSGTNIKTINNQSILGSGNLDIQGGSITVDQTIDITSENPISNKAISNKATDGNGDVLNADGRYYWGFYSVGGVSTSKSIWLDKINGEPVIRKYNNTRDLSFVETSAITTSISSSSTDAQVPSAKAVYDQLGGLKLVKLTQSAYDALSPNYDSNTLYVIVN